MSSAFEFDVVGRVNASAVITFCNVDFFLFAVRSLDVNLGVSVATVVVPVSVMTVVTA